MNDRQDASAADPQHYQLLFENEQVRALRIVFGPGEGSVMHHHPASTLVFLTDGQVRFHLPDGSALDFSFQAGQAQWVPATTHRPENAGSEPFEIIQLELKP
jgi:quercetin dioxygenase-like cupin family protein